MQRDFDLVVTILGALRDAPGPNLSTHDIKEAALAHEQGLQLVAHHLDLLADAGLVKQVSETAATAGDTAGASPGRVTTRWNRTKKTTTRISTPRNEARPALATRPAGVSSRPAGGPAATPGQVPERLSGAAGCAASTMRPRRRSPD